jgi:hypothetical protein
MAGAWSREARSSCAGATPTSTAASSPWTRDHHRRRPPRLLEISAAWGSTAAGQPGTRTQLAWELGPDGDHTLLHFTSKVEAPDQDVPAAAGWHLHPDALATILAGGGVDIAHPEHRFAPIHQAYAEKYGATPAPDEGGEPQATEPD